MQSIFFSDRDFFLSFCQHQLVRLIFIRRQKAFSIKRIGRDFHYTFRWRLLFMRKDRWRIFLIQKIVRRIIIHQFLPISIDPGHLLSTTVVLHQHRIVTWIVRLKWVYLWVQKCMGDDKFLIFKMRAWCHFGPGIWMDSDLRNKFLLEMIELSNERGSDFKVWSTRA